MATSARKSAAASAVAMTVFVVLVAALAVLPHGALGERRCRNPACTEAISIVRAFRDFYAPDGSFSFRRLATFSVLSKDGNMWEGNVRLHHHHHHHHHSRHRPINQQRAGVMDFICPFLTHTRARTYTHVHTRTHTHTHAHTCTHTHTHAHTRTHTSSSIVLCVKCMSFCFSYAIFFGFDSRLVASGDFSRKTRWKS